MTKIKLGDRPYESIIHSPASAELWPDSCYYTVVRYVPYPIAEEFGNFAVIVFTETEVQCRIKDLKNALIFGSDDDRRSLQEFCDQLVNHCSEGRLCFIQKDEKTRLKGVQRAANSWVNEIQFREPCGSLGSVSDAIDGIANDFLGEGKWVKN
jgi:hypothetical protein